MSRTRRRGELSKSPIDKYVTFTSGKVRYYDKELEEEVLRDNIDFVLLDSRFSISGWDVQSGSAIFSNMVSDITRDKFVINSSKDGNRKKLGEGVYKEVKKLVRDNNGKLTINLIGVSKLDGVDQIVNLQLKGASFSQWVDFQKNNDEYDGKIVVSNAGLFKKGNVANEYVQVTKKEINDFTKKVEANPLAQKSQVWFNLPKLELTKASEEELNSADEKDKVLQKYFDGVTVEKDELTNNEELEMESTQEKGGKSDIPFYN